MTGDSLTGWVVAAVAAGILGTLAFLVRHSFSKFETTLEGVGKKLEELSATVARSDGDRRVAEVRFEGLQQRVEKLERELRELSEGIAR